MDEKMLEESIMEEIEKAQTEQDPDPETVATIEALEAERKDPDKLMLGALENVCRLIDTRVKEVEEWGSDSAKIAEINRSIADLAETAVKLHSRLSMRRTLDRLYTMDEAERKNEENIRKWRDEHEQISGSSRSD